MQKKSDCDWMITWATYLYTCTQAYNIYIHRHDCLQDEGCCQIAIPITSSIAFWVDCIFWCAGVIIPSCEPAPDTRNWPAYSICTWDTTYVSSDYNNICWCIHMRIWMPVENSRCVDLHACMYLDACCAYMLCMRACMHACMQVLHACICIHAFASM